MADEPVGGPDAPSAVADVAQPTSPTGLDPVDRPSARGVLGPFTRRHLLFAVAAVSLTVVVVTLASQPLGRAGPPGAAPAPTAYVVGERPAQGIRPGEGAPEFVVDRADGTRFELTDLDGLPIRLADIRGRLVWVNFWATWCPPCQQEMPVLRQMHEEYAGRGLSIVAISVQETAPDDVRAYARRYDLRYTIAFDASADAFRLYRVFAIPTQFFIGPDGILLDVVTGPLSESDARARIEAWLPPAAQGGG